MESVKKTWTRTHGTYTHKPKWEWRAVSVWLTKRSDENEKQMKWKRNSFLGSFFISSLIGNSWVTTREKRKRDEEKTNWKERNQDGTDRDVQWALIIIAYKKETENTCTLYMYASCERERERKVVHIYNNQQQPKKRLFARWSDHAKEEPPLHRKRFAEKFGTYLEKTLCMKRVRKGEM